LRGRELPLRGRDKSFGFFGFRERKEVKEMTKAKGKTEEVKEMAKRMDGVNACTCGHNRWETVVKGRKWKCRKCGKMREAKS
jgi:glucosamine 6-phosphate synthetase-like amidotransferase/phosphosugar isomerase protein